MQKRSKYKTHSVHFLLFIFYCDFQRLLMKQTVYLFLSNNSFFSMR